MPAFDLAWTYVSDMDQSVAFYSALLHAEVQYASPDWTSIRADGITIGLHCGAETPTAKNNFTLSFVVDDILAVRHIAESLNAKTGEYHETPRGVLFTAEDPDGNTLQFMQPGFTLAALLV